MHAGVANAKHLTLRKSRHASSTGQHSGTNTTTPLADDAQWLHIHGRTSSVNSEPTPAPTMHNTNGTVSVAKCCVVVVVPTYQVSGHRHVLKNRETTIAQGTINLCRAAVKH
jgi:hypothetical protein